MKNPALTALAWIAAVTLPLGLILVIAGAQIARNSYSSSISPVLVVGIALLVLGALVGVAALIISASRRSRSS